jgi:hypothetical protein
MSAIAPARGALVGISIFILSKSRPPARSRQSRVPKPSRHHHYAISPQVSTCLILCHSQLNLMLGTCYKYPAIFSSANRVVLQLFLAAPRTRNWSAIRFRFDLLCSWQRPTITLASHCRIRSLLVVWSDSLIDCFIERKDLNNRQLTYPALHTFKNYFVRRS